MNLSHRLALVGGVLIACFQVLSGSELKVAVSLLPQADIVRQLGGERVEVTVVLPSGVDHESYSPRPKTLRNVATADLYWATGVGFEQTWLPKLSASNPKLEILEWKTDEGDHSHHHHDHDHDHDHGHDHAGHEDLHRWLDIGAVERAAGVLAQKMAALDPDGAAVYAANAASFSALCQALDTEIKGLLAPYAGRRFYVYHGAFGYFAEAYGLEQVALEREGREPSLRALSEMISTARSEGVRAVYLQPQIQAPAAEQLARAIGAEVVVLDPLAENWASNMREIAQTLAEGFASVPSSTQ